MASKPLSQSPSLHLNVHSVYSKASMPFLKQASGKTILRPASNCRTVPSKAFEQVQDRSLLSVATNGAPSVALDEQVLKQFTVAVGLRKNEMTVEMSNSSPVTRL